MIRFTLLVGKGNRRKLVLQLYVDEFNWGFVVCIAIMQMNLHRQYANEFALPCQKGKGAKQLPPSTNKQSVL